MSHTYIYIISLPIKLHSQAANACPDSRFMRLDYSVEILIRLVTRLTMDKGFE